MKAYISNKENLGSAKMVELERPPIKVNQVLIKVLAVSLNQRDLRMIDGTYTYKFEWGKVLGADCCGQIVKCGAGIIDFQVGDLVVVNPNVKWGDVDAIPSADYSILGSPLDGVMQEYIAIDEAAVFAKPEHLSVEESSCLPLTGLTAYRALFTKGGCKAGDVLFIPGISGNVSQMVFQFAKALNSEIHVSSSKDHNIDKAIKAGAKSGYNYKKESLEDFCLRSSLKFDLVVDSIGGDQLNNYIKQMRTAGRIAVYGSMKGVVPHFDIVPFYYKQLSLIGTLMGNDNEFKQMIGFVSQYQVRPTIDSVFGFEEINTAFSFLRTNKHYGKVVVKF